MEEFFIVKKQIGAMEYLFDAKNMLLFDITKGFNEHEYEQTVDSLQDYVVKPEDTLSKVVLNISNTCNYKCTYCYANHGNYGKIDAFMDLSTLKSVIDDLLSANIYNIGIIELFGGEPTLNKDLIEMIDLLNNKFNVSQFMLTTNGSGTEDLVRKLAKYPMKYYVSIDGPREINDALRGTGSYYKAMRFISFLNKYDADYCVSATYTKLHQKHGVRYQDLYAFANDNNMSIRVNTVISADKNIMCERRITKLDIEAELERTLDSLKKGDLEVNFDPYIMRILKGLFLSIKSTCFCDDLSTNVSIHYDYDGCIYNCFKLWDDKRFKLSSIKSQNEILDLNNKKDNFALCKKCWARYLCELCVVDTFLGDEAFPFLSEKCIKRDRFDIALEKILEKVVSGEIVDIKNNFINYLS